MKCPVCGNEFKDPRIVAGGKAGGKIGGKAKVSKGFGVAGQPSHNARVRGWNTRRKNMQNRDNEGR